MSTQTNTLLEELLADLNLDAAELRLHVPKLIVQDYKLIIFDFDGTLVEFKTDVVLPNVVAFFTAMLQLDDRPKLAIASNQGGVSLHYWMKEGKFGEGKHLDYPTLEDAEARFNRFLDKKPIGIPLPIFVCYAYKSSKGNWAVPPSFVDENDRNWWATYRKPEPGMLLDAMEHYGVAPQETLMVGDMDEDLHAANRAACHYMTADAFFNRVQNNG